jgi:hypothetical protein
LKIFLYFKARIIEKHRKDTWGGGGGHWKRLQNFLFKIIKSIERKDIMGVKNINYLVGENEISYSKI